MSVGNVQTTSDGLLMLFGNKQTTSDGLVISIGNVKTTLMAYWCQLVLSKLQMMA